jgi:hypothetical protein
LVGFGRHAHLFKYFMDPHVPFLLLFPSGSFEYEIQVGPYGTVVEQLEILKYDT